MILLATTRLETPVTFDSSRRAPVIEANRPRSLRGLLLGAGVYLQ